MPRKGYRQTAEHKANISAATRGKGKKYEGMPLDDKSDYDGYYKVWRRYGVSPRQYDEMLALQGGVCAICHEPETRVYVRTGRLHMLSVDHDHLTGRVRGLLCHVCNTGLGHYERLASLRVDEYLEGR